MFKNYFVTAINNLVKNKLYSAINICGLAIGLASCILIVLYVQDETSYDKHWQNAERIYRVNKTIEFTAGTLDRGSFTSILAQPALSQYFAEEISNSIQIFQFSGVVFQRDTQTFAENHAFVDGQFLNIFPLEVVDGDLEAALQDPSSIALSQESASKMFGSENPIGEVLAVDVFGRAIELRVAAIYRQPVENSILDLPSISKIRETTRGVLGAWQSQSVKTYIQLGPEVDFEQFSALLPDFIDQNIDISAMMAGSEVKPSDRISYDLQNISDIHLNSAFDDSRAGGSSTAVLTFAAIAVLVLLIGSINFTILTTVKATQRAREVAMRKVVGARRRQLIVQFLGESFIIVLLSMLLALVAVELVLPVFESFVNKSLDVSYSNPETYLSLLLLLLIVSFIGGLYPAFVLSRFRPASTLKANRSTDTKGAMVLRNALVIFQFTVSIALIIATSVVYIQINYSNSRDPGFNKEGLIGLSSMFSLDAGQKSALKQELLALPAVSQASFSVFGPMQGGYNIIAYTRKGLGAEPSPIMLPTFHIDSDFFDTYEIPLLAGRYYEQERDQSLTYIQQQQTVDTYDQDIIDVNTVLNSSAARLLGFNSAQEAIGKDLGSSVEVNSPRGDVVNLTIVGVVADVQFSGLRTLPRPEIYTLSPSQTNYLTLRFQGNRQTLLAQIQSVWENVVGDTTADTVFINQAMQQQFSQERTEALILVNFSLLAISIACLGLFGSASFTVERRTKEIGLRKVMGAKVKDIVRLHVWQFSKPILMANLFAWPIAVWAMLNWLQQFPYQIDSWLLGPLCIAAGFIALAISWLTVAINTTRVARGSPIQALRYE